MNIDEENNLKADARLWRLSARDRQLTLAGKELHPLLAPEFQAIIGNPQIEAACMEVEDVADTEEKMRQIKDRLGKNELSQLHISVDVRKGKENNIELLLEEFRVVVAAPTVTALARILKHVNGVKEKVMPQMIAPAAVAGKKESPQKPPSENLVTSEPPVEGVVESKTAFRGKLRNIVLMLPETVRGM